MKRQLLTPMDAIIFDCDGTLSTIEGIDELANHGGVADTVKALTAEAMGKVGMNPQIYEKRLQLVKPTLQKIQALGEQYFSYQVPDVANVIKILNRLNKKVFLISAGVNPAVSNFGEQMGIPRENIFAVDIIFDSEGHYVDFDRSSPLTFSLGKREIVLKIKEHHPHITYIGDGLNDYVVHDLVTRFVGYGGAYYRQNIADLCEFYISSLSMAPLLPLALTQDEFEKLTPEEQVLFHKGEQYMDQVSQI